MSAAGLNGALVASKLLTDPAQRVELLKYASAKTPCLATVLVGDDPASHTYVRMKVNRSAQANIASRRIDLPSTTTTAELVDVLTGLSADDTVDGILLQHPVPAQID